MDHSYSTRPTGHERPLRHKAVIFCLMGDFATRKSSNMHGFSVAIISLNKIGKGRIQDPIGDTPFPVTFKCPVRRPSESEILVEAMTQFFMHVEHKNTSLQLSEPSWISNCRPTPGVLILNTRLGLLNMILSSPLKMAVDAAKCTLVSSWN